MNILMLLLQLNGVLVVGLESLQGRPGLVLQSRLSPFLWKSLQSGCRGPGQGMETCLFSGGWLRSLALTHHCSSSPTQALTWESPGVGEPGPGWFFPPVPTLFHSVSGIGCSCSVGAAPATSRMLQLAWASPLLCLLHFLTQHRICARASWRDVGLHPRSWNMRIGTWCLLCEGCDGNGLACFCRHSTWWGLWGGAGWGHMLPERSCSSALVLHLASLHHSQSLGDTKGCLPLSFEFSGAEHVLQWLLLGTWLCNKAQTVEQHTVLWLWMGRTRVPEWNLKKNSCCLLSRGIYCRCYPSSECGTQCC